MTEKKRLVATVKKWRESHFPSDDAAWHIQNLLGDYLGWGTKEQEEVTNILSKYDRAYKELSKV